MRNRLVFGAVWIALAGLPAAGRAQFQPPNPDELKMTADPKAPGADAVFLETRETDNDALGYREIYERIKVLTDKGKDLASIEIPFVQGDTQIKAIHARTIQPDGTILPLTVKPEDLLSEKAGDLQLKRKVFTLPGVEVGSVLEYQYEIDYDGRGESYAPHWAVQRRYYVQKAHFEFVADGALLYTYRLPEGTAIKAKRDDYKLDVSEVPPIPDEEWMPPVDSFFYGVSFYYSNATNQVDFWKTAAREWSDVVNGYAESSKTIKAAVNDLVAPGDSDRDKAKKLYAAVQALDNTDYSRARTASERRRLKLKEEKHAEDTWKQKSGSSNAIALLYLAMVRAAGLTAYAIDVVDRDKGVFDPGDFELDQFDSVLVAINIDGKLMATDPGEKMCPFGMLSWRHSGAAGIGQSADKISFSTLPQQLYTNNTTQRTGVLMLAADGAVTGQIEISMTGQEALRWRQEALRNDESEVKKEFEKELAALAPDGVEVHVDHFLAIDQPDQNLIAVVNLSGSLGTPVGKRLLLPGFFFATRASVPFVNEAERVLPVDMHYGSRVTDQITYRLPVGMTVEGAPQDADVAWPGHALLVVRSKTGEGEITVGQTLSNAFTLAKAEEYQDLRGFYQKVAAADQEQVVLAAAPKGSGTPVSER
jgi:Domain of Unknown Function with PDB structure (DUF3857)/Transglutaminase-like superfamily